MKSFRKKLSDIIIYVFLLNVVFISYASNRVKTDIEKWELIGNIRSVEIREGLNMVSQIFFNKDGKLIDQERSIKTPNEQTWIKTHTKYTYNSSGKLSAKFSYIDNGLMDKKTLYSYSKNGKETEETTYDSKEVFLFKYVYIFNPQGDEIEGKFYKKSDAEERKWVKSYDGKGNLTSLIWFKTDGSIDYKVLYEYDENNYQSKNLIYKADGSLDERREYKHDGKGNVIEEITYKSDNSIQEKKVYKYMFDSIGNWTNKITSIFSNHSGKLSPDSSSTTFRTITYY